jgi:hypothetical protein
MLEAWKNSRGRGDLGAPLLKRNHVTRPVNLQVCIGPRVAGLSESHELLEMRREARRGIWSRIRTSLQDSREVDLRD